MNACYWLLPVIAAAGGWLCVRTAVYVLFYPVRPVVIAGLKIQGVLPARHARIAAELGRLVKKELSFAVIEQQLTRPETLQKVMPSVEQHVDDFLRIRLPKSMPMIGMLIGEKTIAQMKSVFMTELETLFPAIIHNYVQALEADVDPGQLVTEKINLLSPDVLNEQLYRPAAAQLAKLSVIGVVVGFATGLVEIAVLVIA